MLWFLQLLQQPVWLLWLLRFVAFVTFGLLAFVAFALCVLSCLCLRSRTFGLVVLFIVLHLLCLVFFSKTQLTKTAESKGRALISNSKHQQE